ncbi:MAG TPA: hypothetical protein VII56_14240 [Rhizomicrobium sp.]
MNGFLKRLSSSRMARARFFALVFAAALATTSAALAGTSTIWTNSAGAAPILQQWDLSGNLLKTIHAPHGNNGRGIAQIGDILYYTANIPSAVYAYNFVTNTDLGVVFYVNGTTHVSAIAYDGSSFYIRDYSGPNKVFKYSPTGTLQATIPLVNCTNVCDGLEYANGKLISNRADPHGPYDVYSLTGSLLTPAFIADPNNYNTSGIAFDGTSYFVARTPGGQILKFNSSGVYQSTINLLGAYAIEDISVDYDAVLQKGTLKICKAAGLGVTAGQPFTFNLAAAGSAASTLIVPAGLAPAGSCVVGPAYPTGSTVTISEQKPGGVFSNGWATDIAASPPARLLSSSFSQAFGSPYQGIANVAIGTGVTEVTFMNTKPGNLPIGLIPSAQMLGSGYLEVCKIGNVHGSFSFTVTGVTGTITVSAGACSPALNVPSGNIVITELPSPSEYWLPGACCTTLPANRQVTHNDTLQTSTVNVVAGDISTETIAYIQNTVN